MGGYDPERDYTLQPNPPRDPADDDREVDEMWSRYQRMGIDLERPWPEGRLGLTEQEIAEAIGKWRRDNVECPSCDGEGFLAAPCADGETRRFECFDCDGTGQVTPENVEEPT